MRRIATLPLLLLAFATPSAAASWQALGPQGGYVECVALDPQNPATVYAGVYTSGVWKSADRGATWAPTGAGPDAVYAIAIDPTDPSRLYASGYNSVSRSDDAGATWTRIEVAPTGSREVYALAIDPQNPSTVYAGAASFAGPQMGGVLKSEDGGTTWSQANAGLTDIEVYALAMDPQTASTLYAGTEGGLFKSIDGAATWAATAITDEVRTIAIDPVTPSVVWVGTETGLARSTDGGLTWTEIVLGLAGEVDSIAIIPTAPATVYASGRNITTWKTTDGGATWARLIDSPGGLQLAIDPSAPSTVYLVIAGLFKSRNGGGTWQPSEGGMHAVDATSVVVVPDAPDTIYAANFHTMYSTIDGGATWSHAIVPTSDVF